MLCHPLSGFMNNFGCLGYMSLLSQPVRAALQEDWQEALTVPLKYSAMISSFIEEHVDHVSFAIYGI